MNHKSILILMMIFLFGAACTACGAGKGTEEQNASGSSVSTSSASGSPVREGDDSGGKAKKLISGWVGHRHIFMPTIPVILWRSGERTAGRPDLTSW